MTGIADAPDDPSMAGEPAAQFLYLTMVGRRTGLARQIEIWYLGLGDRFYLISELRERAQWVRNVQAEPRITIRLGDWTSEGRARVVDPDAEPDLAAAVSAAFDLKYGWSDGLIVELEPLGGATGGAPGDPGGPPA